LETPLLTYGHRNPGPDFSRARQVTAEQALLNLQDPAKGDLGAALVSRVELVLSKLLEGVQRPDVLDPDEFPGGPTEASVGGWRRDLAASPPIFPPFPSITS
jgi:hypothetical protein